MIIASITVFGYWMLHDPVKGFSLNEPGLDNRPAAGDGSNEIINIGESFINYHGVTSELSGKWNRFRGADFDNINKESIRLIDNWGGKSPEILWEVELGEGHAAPAVYNGRVFLLDYDEIKKADALRCFSLESGEEMWRRWYKVNVKRNHGMSRTVPAVSENFVVTIGPRGHVMCTDTKSGDYLWGIDLVKEFNAEIPFWYTGQCPLIDNDTAVIAAGGSSLVMGVECSTGKVVWQTPNPDKWKMSHSSVIPMDYKGQRMYVYAAVGGICGISAGKDKGKVLWTTDEFAPTVMAPSPVILDNGMIFITAGYGAGSMLFQIGREGENYFVEVLQKYKPNEGLASEQQTPIFYNGHLFSILPKDAGVLRNQFVCCNFSDVTDFQYTSGKTERFGLGPYIMADDKFFILNDDGTLTIARADVSKFVVLDKAKIMDGQDAWGPIAIVDGRLLMRDSKKMVCIDIKAR